MFESVKSWFHRHRKAVIITATVLTITGTVAVLLIKGKKVKIPVAELAEKLIPEIPKTAEASADMVSVEVDGIKRTFPRTSFIRQLHEGWNPSAAKLAEAAEMGIKLNAGETLVDACTVTMKVA